jgi:hypothetical protein
MQALELLYRLLPLWSDTNVLDWDLQEVLDKLDVGPTVFGKFAKDLDLGDVGLPSWQGGVLNLDLSESVKIGYMCQYGRD